MTDKQLFVAITGASGYISGHIIEQLLAKGHRVRAVLRDASNQDKIAHLHKFPQKPGQLEIVDGDYVKAFQGVDVVIHTATPYIYTAPDPQRDIVDPAIKMTLDAIKAAIEAKVKRIVVTSSGGAFISYDKPQGYVFTEKDWNNWSSLTNHPYFYSKRLAEQAAWEFWNNNKSAIELVVLNPLMVMGPPQAPYLNSSLGVFTKLAKGEQTGPPNGFIGIADVRDVARAHILAAEHPKAVGRRLFLAAGIKHWKQLANIIHKAYPQYGLASEESSSSPNSIDTTPLQELGFGSFIDIETTFKDTISRLQEFKLI